MMLVISGVTTFGSLVIQLGLGCVFIVYVRRGISLCDGKTAKIKVCDFWTDVSKVMATGRYGKCVVSC